MTAERDLTQILIRSDLPQYLIVSTLILRGRVRAKAGRHALAVQGEYFCLLFGDCVADWPQTGNLF